MLLWLVLLVSYLKNHFKDWCKGAFPLSFLRRFRDFKFSYVTVFIKHFELILVNHVAQRFNFILHVVIQFFQNCLLKRLSFPLSGISVLFQWSMGLFLCQRHTVLWYSLKSGHMMPPGMFFFLRIALAIWALLWYKF